MSEVDDMVQTQARTNHSQEWAKQRRTFLEEKHGLSLLTGKRKPNVPQVELCEEVPIGAIKLSEMTGADTGSVDKPTNRPQEEYPQTTSSTIWDEAASPAVCSVSKKEAASPAFCSKSNFSIVISFCSKICTKALH